MENSINDIITKSLLVNKTNLKNINTIITNIKNAIDNNKGTIIEANTIDKKNNNGIMINFDIIDNIFSNLEEENTFYGDVIISQKDDDKKLIYGEEILDKGNVVVITDGNPYTMIEMIIRNIKAGNTTVFSNNGFMYGTNNLLIEIVKKVLEEYNLNDLVQLYITDNYEDILSNFANIDLVVCIGDHNLQRLVLTKSNNETIVSGYENFDLYIEDLDHIDFINKIIDTNLNINIYIKEDINIDYDNSIKVYDLDEAIAQINYNGNRFSTSIFTNSKENASKFIREIKSNIVTINTSPTIERVLDITQEDLSIRKKIIYPLQFNIEKELIENDII